MHASCQSHPAAGISLRIAVTDPGAEILNLVRESPHASIESASWIELRTMGVTGFLMGFVVNCSLRKLQRAYPMDRRTLNHGRWVRSFAQALDRRTHELCGKLGDDGVR